MTRFALSFTPLLPVAAALGPGSRGRRGRGARLPRPAPGHDAARASALALLILALADPSLVREDRKGEKDVVAVVLDQSGSQTIGERAAQTAKARAAHRRRASRRSATSSPASSTAAAPTPRTTARGCSPPCRTGLADVPPDRIAGVLMVTDGVVARHPGRRRRRSASRRRCTCWSPATRASATAASSWSRRRASASSARTRRSASACSTPDDTGEPVAVTVRRDGVEVATLQARVGARIDVPVRIDHAGPNVVEIEVPTLPGELTGAQQQGGRHHRRRARQAQGAARLGRAARGRAHVAQHPEVRRQRRPRALHHPAPAREAGRHADQRAGADRLPDQRAVRHARSAISTSSSSTAIRTSRSCPTPISRTSPATCATAARC